jgi:hypothetical protein
LQTFALGRRPGLCLYLLRCSRPDRRSLARAKRPRMLVLPCCAIVQRDAEDRVTFDFEALAVVYQELQAAGHRVPALLYLNPHNPTGQAQRSLASARASRAMKLEAGGRWARCRCGLGCGHDRAAGALVP